MNSPVGLVGGRPKRNGATGHGQNRKRGLQQSKRLGGASGVGAVVLKARMSP
jgi:hypothetical protein